MVDFRGAHFEAQIILVCVRWYVAYPLSYRHLEEMMQERGVSVDHSAINRWVIKYSPRLEQALRGHRRPVGKSWHLDETDVKVKGEWRYLYRAVDGAGQTVDFLLTSRRDHRAAKRFLQRAIRSCGVPEKMTIDQSRANKAAIESYNARAGDRYRDPPSKVSQQPDRARSPGHQTPHPPDAGIQIVLGSAAYPGRDRARAYDTEGAADEGGEAGPNSGRTVLLLGCITPLKDRTVLLVVKNCDSTIST